MEVPPHAVAGKLFKVWHYQQAHTDVEKFSVLPFCILYAYFDKHWIMGKLCHFFSAWNKIILAIPNEFIEFIPALYKT